MHVRDLRLLTYFVRVAERGTVRGAARDLHVSAPVVSKAVADLEDRLGVSLFRRGRRLALTSRGETVLAHALAMVEEAERAMHGEGGAAAEPSGTVSVTLPTELCVAWLPPLLERFEATYPRVTPRFSASDVLVPLEGSEHDMGLRAIQSGPVEPPREAIARLPLVLVGAPHLRVPRGRRFADHLARIPFIGFSQRGAEAKLGTVDAAGEPAAALEIRPRFFVDNALVAHDLALRGAGAALVTETIARDALADGRLVRLTRRHRFGHITIALELRDRMPSPAARALAHFLRDDAGRHAPSGRPASDGS